MASLSVHLEELHDLPQQRGTRGKRSLASQTLSPREGLAGETRGNDRLVTGHTSVDSRDVQWKNQRVNLFQLGDSMFTEGEE